jgi:hypothetical protein
MVNIAATSSEVRRLVVCLRPKLVIRRLNRDRRRCGWGGDEARSGAEGARRPFKQRRLLF